MVDASCEIHCGGKTSHRGADREVAKRPQILTNCFGKYIVCHIGWEQIPVCNNVAACLDNTAQHTLKEFPAWTRLCRELIVAISVREGRKTISHLHEKRPDGSRLGTSVVRSTGPSAAAFYVRHSGVGATIVEMTV